MEDEVYLVDIPSDAESIDSLRDSEDENDQLTRKAKDAPDHPFLLNTDVLHESESEEEEVEQVEEDGTWSRRSVPRTDIPFIKNFGPNIPTSAKTPLDIFFCLFPHTLVDTIVEQTNLYAQQKNSKQEPAKKEELLVFLGINILMVNRFGFYLSHLHINDNKNEPKKGETNYDKLFKLRPLIDTLGQTFKNCWNPGKYQAIDESMIKFKGRNSMKQFMPAKPIKRGYKMWTRADESGFVSEFQMYTGKAESAEKQLGARVVKDLTRELVGGNHHVYFDNFFTGVDLLASLKRDNIFACGTVRANRAKLPKNQQSNKKFEKVNRRQKDGSLLPINCPVVSADYNKHMGYVDYSDRLLATYKIDRKSKRWWLRLFWHFLDLVVVNSFIIYKNQNTQPTLTLKQFRLQLVEQLVDRKLRTSKGRKRKQPEVNTHKPKVSLTKRHTESAHMPEHSTDFRRCAHWSTREASKRTAWHNINPAASIDVVGDDNCPERGCVE
ncbi:piggyBac transposable element-derived protein 4-like [Leptopilina heterotoma]|uniref:piggyBac transposable element-derived protein 4-like n=1 Tax=Leptopilina heterotoma TaxID=63436 RepID=UPI001CA7BDB2|nr:piggyBac transposable element-derived protein 4-like [Leptopilina heterotoma]